MDKLELIPEVSLNATETEVSIAEAGKPAKKKFIVPEISVPVDVLEATTFFQAVDSGVTN